VWVWGHKTNRTIPRVIGFPQEAVAVTSVVAISGQSWKARALALSARSFSVLTEGSGEILFSPSRKTLDDVSSRIDAVLSHAQADFFLTSSESTLKISLAENHFSYYK
jgi:hypothetical protein